ncbi:DUF4145 domain-containing protein [Endozoicomonas numazuensis]|uniref:DUF4145 domain-containing protein n=1 Tax=Endozoicomonas numazuensis TaxID=1137799 RepID=A0A081NF44_9GAMM|nr:DUF4145 domain-containing protein [Endozoicomonas numazuensis]KEQ17067.1 hypothetical protein GZ78_14335 [Endozoicomonas numazuensis]
MNKPSKQKIKNFCTSCQLDTWHDVEGYYSESSDPEHYHCQTDYSVVKCRGCETASFRRELHDYEAAYPTHDNEWEVPSVVDTYPLPPKGNLETYHLPDIVSKIYQESCSAYSDKSYTLAGIGFRAIIEAVCNDQDIKGKELSTKINNLSSKGLISKKDSNRLHSIRFLGNDAAHDIKTPSLVSLEAALVIIEHLLTTVYILDKTSKGKLEEVIEEYEKIEELLIKKIDEYDKDDELPLQKFLGKDIRLISGSIQKVEKALNEKIGKGEFKKLKHGKKDKFLNSKEELQHYIVA